MSEERHSEVLGALPRTRPHRRSEKRGTRATDSSPAASGTAVEAMQAPERGAVKAETAPERSTVKAETAPERSTVKAETAPQRMRQPAQPGGMPTAPRTRKPAPAAGADVLGTAVQAAAELAEIGLSLSARAIRSAVSRLPRP